jgi:DNA invertase Pin-like site-specific DNA recombinase
MRAALYARTACLTQDLKSAVELQLEALRNYATQNGMEIVEEFTDAGYSGLQRDRPGLDHMCHGARRHGFDVLLTRDPERLARDSVLQVSLLEELEQFGVRTIFLQGGPAEDRLSVSISRRQVMTGVKGSRSLQKKDVAMRELSRPVKELARGTSRPRFVLHRSKSLPRASVESTNFLPGR